jgi:uncharacterized integral membrane protein (TIGR00698 family)
MTSDGRPELDAQASARPDDAASIKTGGAGAVASRPALMRHIPGLALCAIASGAAAWLGQRLGLPVILVGLMMGLALNALARPTHMHAGLDFASRYGLRVGIVLLGLQVTLSQVGAMGAAPFLGLLLVMAAAVMAAMLAARATGQSPAIGLLAGGSTAICGASAALALYGALGRERIDQAQFTLTLVVLAAASGIALVTYPVLAKMLAFSDAQAGFLMGASIHDVAQALGAGFAMSDAAGAQATVVKLTRVALLAPLVALAALWISRAQPVAAVEGAPRPALLPGFILAFLALVGVNSFVAFPATVSTAALAVSKSLLLLAVTATAMRTRIDLLVQLGWRAVLPVLAATLASFGVALVFAHGVL